MESSVVSRHKWSPRCTCWCDGWELGLYRIPCQKADVNQSYLKLSEIPKHPFERHAAPRDKQEGGGGFGGWFEFDRATLPAAPHRHILVKHATCITGEALVIRPHDRPKKTWEKINPDPGGDVNHAPMYDRRQSMHT